jgi:ADP-ribose pyrophosphatase YjhB (NUDIX family)
MGRPRSDSCPDHPRSYHTIKEKTDPPAAREGGPVLALSAASVLHHHGADHVVVGAAALAGNTPVAVLPMTSATAAPELNQRRMDIVSPSRERGARAPDLAPRQEYAIPRSPDHLGTLPAVVYAFRFCPDCGSPLTPPARETSVVSQTCSVCNAVHFRNAKPCAGALVVRDGRVLLGRRAIEPARGQWDIPGGFLEPWEHPEDAAVREVAEETGLRIQITQLVSVVVDTYRDEHYTLNLYYLAEVVGGVEQAADDLAELRWFAPEDLPEELAFAHSREVLAAWQTLPQLRHQP